MANIADLLKELQSKLRQHPSIKRDIYNLIDDVYNETIMQASHSTDGYCTRFKVSANRISSIYTMLDWRFEYVNSFFKGAWGFPKETVMAQYPPYQILLLLIAYGVFEHDDSFAQKCLFLLLAILWNGRLTTYIRYCNPDIMAYVVQYMVGKQSLVYKYESPLALLLDHFVPTIYQKYKSYILKDVNHGLKRLFAQSWARLRQVFYSRPSISLSSGSKGYISGLAPLYYKAHEEGKSIKAVSGDTVEQTFTADKVRGMADEVVNVLVFNYPNYPDHFYNTVSQETLIKPSVLKQIAERLHDPQYTDIVKEITAALFRALEIEDKLDLCTKDVYDKGKYVLTRSRSKTALDLQRLIDEKMNMLFHGTDIVNLPANLKSQVRVAIFYFIMYHARKHYCY